MKKVTITIDALEIKADKGMTVLEAALANNLYIPHLCHHPDLKPVGACRLCMVEIEGRGMTTSCNTPVEDGIVVKTDTPEINKVRRIAVELTVVNHRGNCLTCAKDTDCELQRAANYVGVETERLRRLRNTGSTRPIDTSNPFFTRDPNKCVLCGICVRTCREIQGVGAIDFAFRGFNTTVATFGNKPIVDSRCESCGECVVRCPVGALVPKNFQKPTGEVKTVCSYCGCGCVMHLGVRGSEVVSVRADVDNPVNKGVLCVKGRFGHDYVNHPERLTHPLIKRNGKLEEASWDEALDLVSKKFNDIKNKYGPDSIAHFSSAKCTNEENYLMQKFARAVIGTNNVDHCARL